jgi:hypothetical protein
MNGATPLTWQEIKAWNDIADRRLKPWEAKILHEMSVAYVNEVHAGTDPLRQAPVEVGGEITEVKRKAVASAWKQMKQNANEKYK